MTAYAVTQLVTGRRHVVESGDFERALSVWIAGNEIDLVPDVLRALDDALAQGECRRREIRRMCRHLSVAIHAITT